MKCARCSAEVPAQSRFCLRCGNPIGVSPAPNPTRVFQNSVNPTPVKRSSFGKGVAATVIVALIIAIGGFAASHMLQKPAQSINTTMVQAPAAGTSSTLVQAPAVAQATPQIQQPAAQIAAPDNSAISDYLAFLKQIELTKQQLIGEELGAALSSYGNMDANEINAASSSAKAKTFLPKVNQDSAQITQQWQQLTTEFQQRTPPTACDALYSAYYQHLADCQGMFQKVHDSIAQASTDPSGAIKTLSGMLGTASMSADTSASAADAQLAAVCTKYNITKDFTISTGASASGLLN